MVIEHRQDTLNSILPDFSLVPETQIERVKLRDAGAFAQPEFNSAVRDQVERGNFLSYPRWMVSRELDDAVAKSDVFRSLARRCKENFRRRRVRIFF
tara:strand:- start:109 stop:399 length:291 start_codon:yes stop_codon:yes gene_type:complete